jgi:hypothetical protein
MSDIQNIRTGGGLGEAGGLWVAGEGADLGALGEQQVYDVAVDVAG